MGWSAHTQGRTSALEMASQTQLKSTSVPWAFLSLIKMASEPTVALSFSTLFWCSKKVAKLNMGKDLSLTTPEAWCVLLHASS